MSIYGSNFTPLLYCIPVMFLAQTITRHTALLTRHVKKTTLP